jgi:hypothetical protein
MASEHGEHDARCSHLADCFKNCFSRGPEMKYKLSEDELGLLSDLQGRNIPLDEEVLEDIRGGSRGLSIYEAGGSVLESSVFDLDSGGSGLISTVAIHNDSNRPIWVHEFRLGKLWHDAQFRWLDDPSRTSPRTYSYSFPSPGPEAFEREAVLNHRVGRAGRLNPGGWLEGLLLGTAQTRMPDEWRDRQMLLTRLLVYDGRGRQYSSDLSLFVCRKSLVRTRKRALAET